MAAAARSSRPRSTAMTTPPSVAVDARRGGQRGAPCRRQHRQGGVDASDVLRGRLERHEVGLGEVPVVVGVLLDPQRAGATGGLVPVAGLLAHLLPRVEEVDLAQRLVVDGAAEGAQRVEVLDLAARAPGLAGAVDGDVGVDAHRALLHLGVGHAGGEEDGAELAGVLLGLVARAACRPRRRSPRGARRSGCSRRGCSRRRGCGRRHRRG